jgi:hypothetical protein
VHGAGKKVLAGLACAGPTALDDARIRTQRLRVGLNFVALVALGPRQAVPSVTGLVVLHYS